MKKTLLLTLLSLSIVSAYAAHTQYKLEHVSIVGGSISNTDTRNLLSSIYQFKGQPITQDMIENLVRNLYARGIYKNVIVTQTGSNLAINLVPKPVIVGLKINIKGPEEISSTKLKSSMEKQGFAIGDSFSYQNLKKFNAGIQQFYHQIGFFNVEIKPQLTFNEAKQVRITYNIIENRRARVSKIVIRGAKHFSSSHIVNQFNMRPGVAWWNLFSTSQYSAKNLEENIATLQKMYLNNGYADFRITNLVTKKINHNMDVELTFTIVEGYRYRYGDIQVVGNIAHYKTGLDKIIAKAKLRGIFNISKVKKLQSEIQTYLYSKGFAEAKLNMHPQYNKANKLVNISFIIETGPIIYVDKIQFNGNTYTLDKTMRNRIVQQPDSVYSPALVQEGRGNLLRTGFFSTVKTSIHPVHGKNNVVNILYNVNPRPTGTFNFSIGYGTDNGMLYQASISKNNFLGLGSSLSLTGTTESGYKGLSLGYSQPYFTRSGIGIGGSIFFNDYNNGQTTANSTDYSLLSYGVSSNVSIPLSNYTSYSLGLTLEHNRVYDLAPDYQASFYLASLGATNWEVSSNALLFNLGITYNDLNRGFFPQSGTLASANASIAIPVFKNKYYSLSLQYEHYFPLDKAKNFVIKTHELFSYENGFGGGAVPFYNFYTAGGIGSLPGFESGSIGPLSIFGPLGTPVSTNREYYNQPSGDVIGGNAMALASLELIVPTPLVHKAYQNNVRTKFFIDAASVWDTDWSHADTNYFGINENDPGDFSASAGISFQWHLPIGPVVFSYAIPIKKRSYQETQYFQFSIGGTF